MSDIRRLEGIFSEDTSRVCGLQVFQKKLFATFAIADYSAAHFRRTRWASSGNRSGWGSWFVDISTRRLGDLGFLLGERRLGKNFLNYPPADIGEAKVAPSMAIGEEFVIDS